MFLGFYQLGDLLPLRIYTRNARVPTLPDEAPLATVYDESGDILTTVKLPPIDQERQTAYFHRQINLGGNFTAQRYTVVYSWKYSGVVKQATEEFEIVAGGTTSGAGIAMHFFRQASADYVLLQDDAGTLTKLRGPEVRNAR